MENQNKKIKYKRSRLFLTDCATQGRVATSQLNTVAGIYITNGESVYSYVSKQQWRSVIKTCFSPGCQNFFTWHSYTSREESTSEALKGLSTQNIYFSHLHGCLVKAWLPSLWCTAVCVWVWTILIQKINKYVAEGTRARCWITLCRFAAQMGRFTVWESLT